MPLLPRFNRARGLETALIAAAALITVHVGMTTVDAFGDLRPRNRAQRFDWYYRYGFYTNDSDGRSRAGSRRQSDRPPLDDEGFAGGDPGQGQGC